MLLISPSELPVVVSLPLTIVLTERSIVHSHVTCLTIWPQSDGTAEGSCSQCSAGQPAHRRFVIPLINFLSQRIFCLSHLHAWPSLHRWAAVVTSQQIMIVNEGQRGLEQHGQEEATLDQFLCCNIFFMLHLHPGVQLQNQITSHHHIGDDILILSHLVRER